MGRWTMCVAAMVLCAACGDTDFIANGGDGIVGGTADHGRTPAVVAILVDGGAELCSGALVAPRWVLTARHCVSVTAAAVDCARDGGRVYSNRDPRGMSIVVGDDVRTGVVVAHGDGLALPGATTLCGSDIAMIHLDRPVSGITPMTVSTVATGRGAEIRAVGFGRRGDSARAGVGRRYRREGIEVTAATAREFDVTEGPCSGDSGSPAIDPQRATIVGVLSRGTETCRGESAAGIYTQASAFSAWIRDTVRGTR